MKSHNKIEEKKESEILLDNHKPQPHSSIQKKQDFKENINNDSQNNNIKESLSTKLILKRKIEDISKKKELLSNIIKEFFLY